jgi:hypothetical protein
VAPTDRLVPRFAAEPPQEHLPYGRWAETLSQEFLAACLRVDTEGEALGDPGEVRYFPDRTWRGRTFVPCTCRTSNDFELYGFVSFVPGTEHSEPSELFAQAAFTAETAEHNPEWQLDLSEDVIGSWRGEQGKVATMTLVWGIPLGAAANAGAIVTAELADLAVDQCLLIEGRFTLIGPDAYRGDYLDIVLWSADGKPVARESLYEDDDEAE